MPTTAKNATGKLPCREERCTGTRSVVVGVRCTSRGDKEVVVHTPTTVRTAPKKTPDRTSWFTAARKEVELCPEPGDKTGCPERPPTTQAPATPHARASSGDPARVPVGDDVV